MRPDWPHHENRTLSGYWEINGVKAHRLLESGTEGVLLSPEFTRATGMKTFALEQPIALQLACIGSRSTINYGTNTTIKFGHKLYDKYFDIANVKYYDTILGMPFLRKLGITLDFTSPGAVQIGNEIVPIGKTPVDDELPTEGQRPKASLSREPHWLIEARRTTRQSYNRRERRTHLAMRALGKKKEIPRAAGPNHRLQRLMVSQRVVLTDNDIPRLHEEWMDKINDLVNGIPLELPPLREVNHEINLVDPAKHIRYRLPKCPEQFHEDLSAKIERYTTAEWWVPAVAHQAVPMLCVPKKNNTLRAVFDLREQNENMVKDVTPFPDQDIIRNDIARATYRTKLDMSEAYEQIRMDPADVSKTAFTTILSTFRSQVMQMGDCNAPSTFQHLMTAIFHDCIGLFVHVYMDDIFIFSCLIKEHEKHLGIVFDRLRKNHLFLSKKQVDLYSERVECLSHSIDNQGIHADADKMQRVQEWRTPRTYNDVQRFLGLVQYLAHYMPDVSAYTTPLAVCIRNNHPFEWTPLLDKCLQSIKALACKVPILRLVDPKNPDPIWVITDGSKSGVGAVYGQGPEWQTCRPAGFLSKKFSVAQQHYRTHKHETIVMLEALIKWEDKLLGRKFTLVTDHKGLEYFETQKGPVRQTSSMVGVPLPFQLHHHAR
jgi:Reverse transcriptase (RNA-dependent DNA polymerase)/RNase H-like domain found in reverse transcriptase